MSPINVQLVTEKGDVLENLGGGPPFIDELLPRLDDPAFPLLRYVDPYGDTVFNGLQMEPLLDELARLKDAAHEPALERLADVIEHVARRCQESVGLYLKFVGD